MNANTMTNTELHQAWLDTPAVEKVTHFKNLSLVEATEFFQEMSTRHQYELLAELPEGEQRVWLRILEPDDAADVLQEAEDDERKHFLSLLDDTARDDVQALLMYDEDVAGGLMSPRFARVRPDISVSEALTYVRKQALQATETIYVVYVLDSAQHLLGVTSLRSLFASAPNKLVSDIMRTNVVSVTENVHQEELSRLFAEHDLGAIPVLDDDNRMVGIVTIDDIVDVVEEEATEDIQKIGGSEALGAPYLELSLLSMIQKRAGWLIVLFISEMLTTNAMAHFEGELAKAVILAVFIPLVISSGGNAGSQASTLVIRAMALGEVTLRDWWKVMRRELITGCVLGLVLGAIGFARVVVWQQFLPSYGPHYMLIGVTIGISLIGIVLWGSLMGSLLPLILKRVGFDPATASTPFVATLVDVTGLIIYFTAASIVLHGTLL